MSTELKRGFRIWLWLIPFNILTAFIAFSGVFIDFGDILSPNITNILLWAFFVLIVNFVIMLYAYGWTAKRTGV